MSGMSLFCHLSMKNYLPLCTAEVCRSVNKLDAFICDVCRLAIDDI